MEITCLTWNTHGSSEISEMIQLVKENRHSSTEYTLQSNETDLFAISLQECYSFPKIEDKLNSFPFIQICSMFGLQTILASRLPIKVEFYRIGQGMFGFVNKGFILSVIQSNKRVAHINAHLAPHESGQKERMKQLAEIICFSSRFRPDTVILSGDLNFRCIPNDQALEFKKKYREFKEENIRFNPTYKYKGNVYEVSRTPSFCDRIMAASIYNLRFIKYESVDKITSSDHKPVLCIMEVQESKHSTELIEYTHQGLLLRRIWTWQVLFFIEHWKSIAILLIIFVLRLF